MDRRIAPPAEGQLKSTLERLTTTQPGRDFPLFETKQKALMFAAALGKFLGRQEPVGQRDTSAAIRFDIFQNALDDGFVKGLAIAENSDLQVLSDDRTEEVVNVFEAYAHAGLKELHRRCFERAEDPLDALMDLVDSARVAEDQEELAGMDPAILRDIMND